MRADRYDHVRAQHGQYLVMIDPLLFTLHRYFIWANRLREHFDQAIRTKPQKPELVGFIEWLSDDPGLFMTHWYGSLYVVIEAWQQEKFKDEQIDLLLADKENINLLRLCRNGTFHFQKNYFTAKLFDIVSKPGTAIWVRQVNEAFGRYFLGFVDKINSPTPANS